MDGAGRLADLSEAGFDTFLTGLRDPEALGRLAKAAGRHGLGMLASPDALLGGPGSATRGWPVRAWYLEDEPDVSRTPPHILESKSRETRHWDPDRPRTFVIGRGAPAEKYGRIADVLMLDWYPVPHLELGSVAEQIDLARSHLPEGKPLWMVVQAFDWRQFRQRDPGKPRIGRFPDHSEIRFMSYLSIVHGARGLFYYTFKRPGGRVLSDVPELWQALTRVVHEIRSLQPILERGQEVALPFPAGEDGLEGKAFRWKGREYAIVLNRAGKPARLPEELLDSRWRPLFEPRRRVQDLAHEASGGYHLWPYQVMVFEARADAEAPAQS